MRSLHSLVRCSAWALAAARGLTAAPVSAADPIWQTTPLTPSEIVSTEAAVNSDYGRAMAGRGDTAVVSAPLFTTESGTSGKVFVFQRSGGTWTEATPGISAPTGRQHFGSAVAIAEDFFAVGAFDYDAAGPQPVRVVSRADVSSSEDIPFPSAHEPGAFFGHSLLFDGRWLFVSDPGANGGDGEVFIYERQGASWILDQSLTETLGSADLTGSAFGFSLAVRNDQLFVGAPFGAAGCAVFSFRRPGTDADFVADTVQPSTPTGSVQLGTRMALSGDGEVLAVADTAFDDEAGVVHLFSLGDNAWHPLGTALQPLDPGDYDLFGQTLAFNHRLLMVGAPGRTVFDEGGAFIGSGSATTFFEEDGEWAALPYQDSAKLGEVIVGPAHDVAGPILAKMNDGVVAFALARGLPCSSNGECRDGFCADHVCCAQACDGTCEACSTELTGEPSGDCAPIPAGDDPDGECATGRRCGQTGDCGGERACEQQPQGLSCGPASCSSSEDAAVPEPRCDGLGDCVQVDGVQCSDDHSCIEGACARDVLDDAGGAPSTRSSACDTSDECDVAAGFYCLDGTCVFGANCSDDGKSAFAEDGDRTSCAPTVCRAGSCLVECRIGRTDCVEGFVCDTRAKRCVVSTSFTTKAPDRNSVACAMRPDNSRLSWASAAFATALLFSRRKRYDRT